MKLSSGKDMQLRFAGALQNISRAMPLLLSRYGSWVKALLLLIMAGLAVFLGVRLVITEPVPANEGLYQRKTPSLDTGKLEAIEAWLSQRASQNETGWTGERNRAF